MKTNKKILVAIVALFVAVSTFVFAACDPDIDDSADRALALAEKCTATSVSLTKDGKTYFSYEKSKDEEAVVSDPYGTGVDAAAYVDFAKAISTSLTAADLEVKENSYDKDSGEISMEASITDAERTLGVKTDDARISIQGNINDGSVKTYTVTYTDANGYTVTVSLS